MKTINARTPMALASKSDGGDKNSGVPKPCPEYTTQHLWLKPLQRGVSEVFIFNFNLALLHKLYLLHLKNIEFYFDWIVLLVVSTVW